MKTPLVLLGIILVLLVLIVVLIMMPKPTKHTRVHKHDMEKYLNKEPIDLVICWAGENSPGSSEYSSRANRDEGILKYSLRSIVKHVPWIRTIYIFTDPSENYPSFLDESRTGHKIKIIDRCRYFNNSNWCPTMNSAAAYANMYKIDGLSDNFIYIDDDTLVLKDLEYTDFFTEDMKKIRTSSTFPVGLVYDLDKVKEGNVKPPANPEQFVNSEDSHHMLALKKDLFVSLETKYPGWVDFVSSHKKRWCCCDNDSCPNPDDDCKECYDELGIGASVPHYEAYLLDKYEYRKDFYNRPRNYNYVEDLTRIQKGDLSATSFFNINNLFEEEDYQRTHPEDFEVKKNQLHQKLEELFPQEEFYRILAT